MKIDKDLKKFLVYKGVLDKYIANKPNSTAKCIASSFAWCFTNEGDEFWFNLHEEYSTIDLDNLQKKDNYEIYNEYIF